MLQLVTAATLLQPQMAASGMPHSLPPQQLQQPLQQPQQQQSPRKHASIQALHIGDPITAASSLSNVTALSFTNFALRVSGKQLLPFTRDKQMIVLQALADGVRPLGPVELVEFREGLPRTEGGATETLPFADILVRVYLLRNLTAPPSTPPVSQGVNQNVSRFFTLFVRWIGRTVQLGLDITSRLLSADSSDQHAYLAKIPNHVGLRPLQLTALQIRLAGPSAGSFGAEQASAVLHVLRVAMSGSVLSSLQVQDFSQSGLSQDEVLLNVIVALYDCPPPGTSLNITGIPVAELTGSELAPPACAAVNRARVTDIFAGAPLMVSAGADSSKNVSLQSLLDTAGLGLQASLVSISDFPSPAATPAVPPLSALTSQQPLQTVPWHLDRLDQQALPLDGQFTASNAGEGVSIYLVSSGVRATHQEFLGSSGKGSRVKPAFALGGLDPLQDCVDAMPWYGFGTFYASLMVGNTQGIARNATLYSVRYRENCLYESDDIWQPGGLPSALDAVISNHVSPAILVIDTWWSPARFSFDDDQFVSQALRDRLNAAEAAGITVITGAGAGLDSTACENQIAGRPTVFAVGALDSQDERTLQTPSDSAANTSCINLWAPGGGLDSAIVGASAMGDTAYVSVIPRMWGAMSLVAGVAAQYLCANPQASPADVRAALTGLATKGVALDINHSPNLLLYTNFTSVLHGHPPPPVVGAATASVEPSSHVGTIVGAVVGSIVGVAVLAAAVVLFVFRRQRNRELMRKDPTASASSRSGRPSTPSTKGSSKSSKGTIKSRTQINFVGYKPASRTEEDWEIGPNEEIQICKRADGRLWELGVGSFGKVYKAIKGGVQEVAVKTLHRIDSKMEADFIREIAMMKFVSRDRNMVQFYGACVQPNNLMLVLEYMQGGDMRRALTNDKTDVLRWNNKGKGIALDIARGLHFLHSNNVIHRDIKSKNILLTRDGRAKIADVGMAKILTDGYFSRDNALGTFAWAAPELLLGERCTEKVDIYSLGVVLWELLTQEVPIRGQTRSPNVPAECPQQVVDVVDWCLQREPKARPTAKQVYDRLLACPPHGVSEEQPTPARPLDDSAETAEGHSRLDEDTPLHAGGALSPDSKPEKPQLRYVVEAIQGRLAGQKAGQSGSSDDTSGNGRSGSRDHSGEGSGEGGGEGHMRGRQESSGKCEASVDKGEFGTGEKVGRGQKAVQLSNMGQETQAGAQDERGRQVAVV
ncbi:hypothetical protein WJX72_012418 [[Myrmecia] bisecta]|uniref:Protein kinase domain-containing protein n=1 Tax=[Myrmecia] bisecta TaxID=41462 RepID=A0AAW1PDK0_9CHLO